MSTSQNSSSFIALLVKGSVANVAGWIVPILLTIVTTPIILDYLGAEAYGIYALMGLILGYAGTFNSPIGDAAIKFIAEAKHNITELGRTIFTAVSSQIIIGLAVSILLFLLAPFFANNLFNIPNKFSEISVWMFRIVAVSFFLNAAMNILGAIPQGFHRFDIFNVVKIAVLAIHLIGSVLILVLGFGLEGVIIFYPLVFFFGIILYLGTSRIIVGNLLLKLSFDRKKLLSMMQFGIWIFMNQGLSLITFQLGKTFLGIYFSPEQLTYYTISTKLAIYLQVFGGNLAKGFFPLTSELLAKKKTEELKQIYLRSFKVFIFLLGFITLLLILLGKEIILLWLGVEYSINSFISLPWLAVWGFFHALGAIPFGIANGAGLPKINTLFSILFASANFVLIALLSEYGPRGIAIGSMLSVIFVSPIFIGYIQKRILKIDNKVMFHKIILPYILIFSFTIMCGIYIPTITENLFIIILLKLALILVIYPSLNFIFKIIDKSEIKIIYHKLFKKV